MVTGFPSIFSAVETLLVHVGAGYRVEKPQSVGERSVINCTLGHVALVSAFIRVILDVRVGLCSNTGGVGEGIYTVRVEDLARLDNLVLFDTEVHSGLRHFDGDEMQRAVLLGEKNDVAGAAVEEAGGGSGEEEDDDDDDDDDEE